MTFKPRDYQTDIAAKAVERLRKLGIVYLAMEVRTGKTFTALMAAKEYGATKVLFLTVKKAISSIEEDAALYGGVEVEVLSIDSAHKAVGEYDLVVVDEAHGIGAFPKPSKRALAVKKIAANLPIILLSGTPHPESLSQLYHQFWISAASPFRDFGNFYKWAKVYVNIVQKNFNGRASNDYSRGHEHLIQPIIDKYFLTFSQQEADFNCTVNEHVLSVPMLPHTTRAIAHLKEHKVINGKRHVVLADTPVKLMSKVHQMSSGSVITEEDGVHTFDTTKISYIRENFKGKKLAIFYKYKGELLMLKEAYGDSLTDDIADFNNTDKHIALQIKAGSMGVNLSKADAQVFVNIDFSSKDYIQARARQQTQSRESCDVYFIFSQGGIEHDIYRSLQKKEDFTSRYYKQFFN